MRATRSLHASSKVRDALRSTKIEGKDENAREPQVEELGPLQRGNASRNRLLRHVQVDVADRFFLLREPCSIKRPS